MKSTDKISSGASGISQQFNRQAGQAPQLKSVVAQLKTGVSAQSVKRPVAPPVYRPQATPKPAQPKMAQAAWNHMSPKSPPVYRPQPTPQVLQTKAATKQHPSVSQTNRVPAAPPAYRPHAIPKALQTKAEVKSVAPLNRPALRTYASNPAPRSGNAQKVVQRQNSGSPQQVLRGAAEGRPHRTQTVESRVIQRVALAMGQDQAHAVSVLGNSNEGWFSSAEEYGLFDGFADFTKNTDKNVTLWGHAGQNRYGGKSVAELVAALKTKKLDKSNHTVLELIGCGPNKTNDQSTETYVQLLQKTLDEDGDFRRTITVKAYPMPEPGGESTNIRFDLIDKFVYVYGDATKLATARTRLTQMGTVYYQLPTRTKGEEETVYQKYIEYLKGINGLQYKTGEYKDVRSHLETTHVIKTHRNPGFLSGASVSESQLLIKKVY